MSSVATKDPTGVRLTKYIPHEPEPPQQAFLWLTCREALYGGAAGGGKSDALLMGALQYVDQPNYAAIIFRKTYTDLSLPGALMDRAHEWLGNTDAHWDGTEKQWTFPSGATINFAYLKNENDKYRYQSAEFQYVAFDELTQFPEADYLYLFSRLRRLQGSQVPIRMRAASNPGGTGHQWVRRRFVDDVDGKGRIFIPARLDDNPHVDREEYTESLMELDEQTRLQLLNGDWSARQPGPWVFDHRAIDAAAVMGDRFDKALAKGDVPPPVDNGLYIGADFGESTHILILHKLERGGYYVRWEHVYTSGEPDREASPVITYLERADETLLRSRFDASKPESMRLFYRSLKAFGGPSYGKPSAIPFGGRPKNRKYRGSYKRQAILYVRKLLENTKRGEPIRIIAISPTNCPVLLEQLYQLQFIHEDTEDVKKQNDHGPDALFAGVAPDSVKEHDR